jgi:uncharacterized protein YbaA (DUF1428 family)
MAYVDGFVVPLPRSNVQKYRDLARKMAALWLEKGALDYQEFIGDDVKPGKLTSFPQSVDLRPDEVVVFSYITYKSRAHRDEVNQKVMGDPVMKATMTPDNMPFDGQRMIYGGFASLFDDDQ